MSIKYIITLVLTLNLCLANSIEIKNEDLSFLYPQDNTTLKNKSGNVIQGIASFAKFWITTQSSGDKFLMINLLRKNGTSLYNHRIEYPSHGQDLSIDYNKEKKLLKLYTVSRNWKGIVSFNYEFKDDSIKYLNTYLEINLDCKHCTSTINEEKTKFAVRDSKYISIYDKNILFQENKKNALISKFKLNKKQLKKGQWFQGIAMKDDLVYCLTSSNKIKE